MKKETEYELIYQISLTCLDGIINRIRVVCTLGQSCYVLLERSVDRE